MGSGQAGVSTGPITASSADISVGSPAITPSTGWPPPASQISFMNQAAVGKSGV